MYNLYNKINTREIRDNNNNSFIVIFINVFIIILITKNKIRFLQQEATAAIKKSSKV